MLKLDLHSKRKMYTYWGGNVKANLWNLPYTEGVFLGAGYKPVNLFDRVYVNEKQSENKHMIT